MHIFGASGHSKVIIDILNLSGVSISAIWDDNPDVKSFCGFPISGNLERIKSHQVDELIIAIGSNSIRKKLATELHVPFGTVMHPKSIVAEAARVLSGSVLMANVVVNADTLIGEHVILNTSCSVDHDCTIDNFVHISPQAGIAGNVQVGEGTHIGIGVNVIQGVKIGAWATIGAGTVVIRDVPDYAVVVGNPGRIIKYNRI